jgi:hypothetical protein
MTNQINLLLRDINPSGWVAISDSDVEAYNAINELVDGNLGDRYPLYVLTHYDEFCDWLENFGLEDQDSDGFWDWTKNKIHWPFSPQETVEKLDKLAKWFNHYKLDNEIENTPEPVENVITIHGKRYKLVEI